MAKINEKYVQNVKHWVWYVVDPQSDYDETLW